VEFSRIFHTDCPWGINLTQFAAAREQNFPNGPLAATDPPFPKGDVNQGISAGELAKRLCIGNAAGAWFL
jgi:hypothetical protein